MLMNEKNKNRGEMYMRLLTLFSIYIDITMLILGLYMLLVQGNNLIKINHLEREGRFSKIVGSIYVVIGVIGIFILIKQ